MTVMNKELEKIMHSLQLRNILKVLLLEFLPIGMFK